jgi:hypothetical protein
MLTAFATLLTIKGAGFLVGFAVALPYAAQKCVRIYRNPFSA